MSRRFNPLSLDALNFLLADVRGALGPFLKSSSSRNNIGVKRRLGL